PDKPMAKRLRRRRICVLDNQNQLRGTGRRSGPFEGGRDGVLFIGCEARVEFLALVEGGRAQHKAVAMQDAFITQAGDSELGVPGAHIAQRLTEPAWNVFEHSRLLFSYAV